MYSKVNSKTGMFLCWLSPKLTICFPFGLMQCIFVFAHTSHIQGLCTEQILEENQGAVGLQMWNAKLNKSAFPLLTHGEGILERKSLDLCCLLADAGMWLHRSMQYMSLAQPKCKQHELAPCLCRSNNPRRFKGDCEPENQRRYCYLLGISFFFLKFVC